VTIWHVKCNCESVFLECSITAEFVVAFAVNAGTATVVTTTDERAVVADSAVAAASSTDSKSPENEQVARRSHNTNSVRSTRPVQLRTSNMTQLGYHQAMLLQASLRMHRNPLLLNGPPIGRQTTVAQPVPSDWTTVSSLRARRCPDARAYLEDSYIVSAETEPDHISVNSKEQKALPSPAHEVQEPLPTAAKRPPLATPPNSTRKPRNTRRRQAPAIVDDNNVIVDNNNVILDINELENGAKSQLSANENEEPLLIDLATHATPPTDPAVNETDVDSILSDSSPLKSQAPTTTRRSLIFEKVEPMIPVVKNRRPRPVTERRFPARESCV